MSGCKPVEGIKTVQQRSSTDELGSLHGRGWVHWCLLDADAKQCDAGQMCICWNAHPLLILKIVGALSTTAVRETHGSTVGG